MCKTSENINIPEGQLCEYGCGDPAIYYCKKHKKFQCCTNMHNCLTRRQKKFEKVLEIINNKDGTCLSTVRDYKNYYSTIKIKCNKHDYIWKTRACNIRNGGWCKKCAIEKVFEKLRHKYKYTLEDLEKVAKSRGGKCLSTKFEGTTKKYTWECANGHEFECIYSNIIRRNDWCRYCNNNSKEQMCRFILEQLTGKLFHKNKKIIKGFELDGYNEELNLCFEYNGKQHYVQNDFFHKNITLDDQKRRDRKIRYECNKLKIRLIVISYKKSNKKSNLIKYIKNKLLNLNINLINENINWDKFNFGESFLEKSRKIVKEKNGELLSTIYISAKEKLKIKCSKGHEFESCYDKLRIGRWCPYCSGNKVCEDNCLATLHPDLAEQWDYKKNKPLLPTEVVPRSEKKVWWYREECGHKWDARICSRSKSPGCPLCNGKRISLENCLETTDPELLPYWSSKNTISPKELQLYSRTLVHWSCPNCQHEWEEFPRNLITRQSKCPNCLKNNPKRFKWNENNIKTLIELRNKNLTFKEISKQIGCTPISARGKYSSLFKVENINNKKWYENFELLKKYKSEFGTIDYIGEYEGVDLGEWISKQRERININTLKEEKKKLLLDFGIEKPIIKKIWMESFEKFKNYLKDIGSNCFPYQYNEFYIRDWVNTQKRQYKNNELISEKIKLLEEIGFSLE